MNALNIIRQHVGKKLAVSYYSTPDDMAYQLIGKVSIVEGRVWVLATSRTQANAELIDPDLSGATIGVVMMARDGDILYQHEGVAI